MTKVFIVAMLCSFSHKKGRTPIRQYVCDNLASRKLRHPWVHAGVPHRKWGIELLCIHNSVLSTSVSLWSLLPLSSSTQRGHCTCRLTMTWVQQHYRRQQQQEADQCRYDWGCVYVGQPLVIAASVNHPLFDSVAALVAWLISSSSPHWYPLGRPLASDSISKPRDHACMLLNLHSYTHCCRLDSWALQTKLRFEPHTAQYLPHFPLSSTFQQSRQTPIFKLHINIVGMRSVNVL